MKTLIPAKARVISKSDKFIWPYNLLEIFFNIDELKTNVTLQLAKENIEDSMDIFNSELVWLCEEMMNWSQFSITKDNKVTELTPRKLAFIVSDLAFRSFTKWSEWNKSPFKVEIIAPNVAIKEFKKANKTELAEFEKLQKQLWNKKEPTNSEIMEEIKKLKLMWPVITTNTDLDQIISPTMADDLAPTNTKTKTKTNQKPKQEWDWKFTSRANLDFMWI